MLHHLVPLVAHSRSFDAEAERKEPFKGVVAIFKEFLDRDAVNLGYMMSCLNMIRKCTIDAVLEDSTPLYTVAEIALAVLRTMSGGRHYNITETTTVSLPLYFYAKPDKNGVSLYSKLVGLACLLAGRANPICTEYTLNHLQIV